VKLPVGLKMDIEGSWHIGKNVKEKPLRFKASEMGTVFTMARRCLLAYANVTRTAYETYGPKTSLLDLLLKY
jgi:hypothetical protein